MTKDNSTNHAKPNNSRSKEKADAEATANLIRQKLSSIYQDEPSAKAESEAIEETSAPLSKHQLFMKQLNDSGKGVAQIQQAWHEYYESLSDKEKHEVWQEFYAANKLQSRYHQAQARSSQQNVPAPKQENIHQEASEPRHTQPTRSASDVKHQLLSHRRPKRKLKAKHHFQSLIFGLGVGSFVVLLMLFGFFNERFIAPFITPSKQVSSTPIIADPGSTSASPNPLILVPKINVEIPVVYNEPSIEEAAIQKALERGVVHYATTPSPGEKGNAVIFGHSSNNLFNPGKYKFAFVLLNRLENGDLFYLNKGGTRYTYKVFKKVIVEPNEVSVLGSAGKPATATLITCDPPGTTLKRLVVIGEQINPDPATNKATTAVAGENRPAALPSDAPTLWSRFFEWF